LGSCRWNIWFENLFTTIRFNTILSLLFSPPEVSTPDPNTVIPGPYDILCLQEVNSTFINILKKNEAAQKDWYITDGEAMMRCCESFHGTLILVRKEFLRSLGGVTIENFYSDFPVTSLRRGLNVIEIKAPSGQVLLRVGTSHFDSHNSSPEGAKNRSSQFDFAVKLLSAPSLAPLTYESDQSLAGIKSLTSTVAPFPIVLCGDTNILAYSELPLSDQYHMRDSFLLCHPTNSDPYRTYYTMGELFPIKEKHEAPRRLDYILINEAVGKVTMAGVFGNQTPCKKDGVDVKAVKGKDWKCWPSDHLGVGVKLEL
jgi:endonuclease/exonuclease/phosphatase family metal-dependent hydrolase